jgi:ferredoxin
METGFRRSAVKPTVPFFNARIEPSGDRFDAWPHQTLLDAMEQSGLHWPSSCRSGSCRTCIGHVMSGQVRYEMDWPSLSAEEKAEGCVLPCVAFPLSDVVLKDPFSD